MEEHLLRALDGETFLGMPDLGDRVYGLRLVGPDQPAHSRLPDGRTVLVLGAKGQLLAATMSGKTAFVQKAPLGMVNASTMEPYARAVARAVSQHVGRAAGRTQRFAQIAYVAGSVCAALTDASKA